MLRLRLTVALPLGSALLLASAASAAPASSSQAINAKPAPIRSAASTSAGVCAALPDPREKLPWAPGERLNFDIDVMGAGAGSLAMLALPPVGKGTSTEYPLRALAASNSFFSKVRKVRGRSTSYVRSKDLHPRRYEEESNEAGVSRSAAVVFQRPSEGALVKVDWTRESEKGKANLRYSNDAFDPVSAAYFLRMLDFEKGQEICFHSYGIRKLWRVTGKVVGLEEVRVPAGVFKAWHLEGVAVRTDRPRSAREIHIWISNDERRLPLAALGVLDLGAVRAQLSHIGEGAAPSDDPIIAELERPLPAAPRPAPAKPKAKR